jgi:hypothetical protein
MAGADEYLSLDDGALLRQCEVHTYKSSGPGGQHRNKVSSAVRLVHVATRVAAHGDDSRSQHENKRLALKRLRMNMAMHLRGMVDTAARPPAFVRECMFAPRGGKERRAKSEGRGARDEQQILRAPNQPESRGQAPAEISATAKRGQAPISNSEIGASPLLRLEVGVKDFRFWRVAAWLLDVLEACAGRVSDSAAVVGITTGNLSDLLTCDRHLLAAAQEIRKRHGLKPLT